MSSPPTIPITLPCVLNALHMPDAETLHRRILNTPQFLDPFTSYRDAYLLHPRFAPQPQQMPLQKDTVVLAELLPAIRREVEGRAAKLRPLSDTADANAHTIRLFSSLVRRMSGEKNGWYRDLEKCGGKGVDVVSDFCREMDVLVGFLRQGYAGWRQREKEGEVEGKEGDEVEIVKLIEKSRPIVWQRNSNGLGEAGVDTLRAEEANSSDDEEENYEEDENANHNTQSRPKRRRRRISLAHSDSSSAFEPSDTEAHADSSASASSASDEEEYKTAHFNTSDTDLDIDMEGGSSTCLKQAKRPKRPQQRRGRARRNPSFEIHIDAARTIQPHHQHASRYRDLRREEKEGQRRQSPVFFREAFRTAQTAYRHLEGAASIPKHQHQHPQHQHQHSLPTLPTTHQGIYTSPAPCALPAAAPSPYLPRLHHQPPPSPAQLQPRLQQQHHHHHHNHHHHPQPPTMPLSYMIPSPTPSTSPSSFPMIRHRTLPPPIPSIPISSSINSTVHVLGKRRYPFEKLPKPQGVGAGVVEKMGGVAATGNKFPRPRTTATTTVGAEMGGARRGGDDRDGEGEGDARNREGGMG